MDLTIYTDDKKPVELSDLIFIIIDKTEPEYIYPCLFINKLWNKCIYKSYSGPAYYSLFKIRMSFIQSAILHGDEKMVKFVKFIVG